MTDIRTRVIATIYEVTKPERPDLSDHAKPLLAGALDSLDYASVLMALEDEYDVPLAEEETEQLGSIDQIVSFLEQKKAA
jgi:acyl carrier protein